MALPPVLPAPAMVVTSLFPALQPLLALLDMAGVAEFAVSVALAAAK